MDEEIRSLAQIHRRFEHRLDHRFEHRLADDQSLLQLIPGVEDLQSDLDRALRADDRRRDRARREAERRGDLLVTSITNLRINKLDVVAAPPQGGAERDERTDVALAAPCLYPDPHVLLQ